MVLAARALSELAIALLVNSPKYVKASVVLPMRLIARLNGKSFDHHTSWPWVSETIRKAPARRSEEAIKAKGVDEIWCVAVNDAFVMGAWGKDLHVGKKVRMMADGSGEFTKNLGLEFDLVARGLGVRSQRYLMILDNGVVKHLAVEAAGKFEVSDAASAIKAL